MTRWEAPFILLPGQICDHKISRSDWPQKWPLPMFFLIKGANPGGHGLARPKIRTRSFSMPLTPVPCDMHFPTLPSKALIVDKTWRNLRLRSSLAGTSGTGDPNGRPNLTVFVNRVIESGKDGTHQRGGWPEEMGLLKGFTGVPDREVC